MIYENSPALIGHTPLMRLGNIAKAFDLKADIVAKIEFFNPAGSVKDRVALHMIEDAERRGVLKPGATIIEPTSGNTGIGIASVAAAKGYKAIMTMPETMSVERQNLLKAYGAGVVLTEGAKGMAGAIEKAHALAQSIEGAVILGQFENPANPQTHEKTTGPEIWEDTGGMVDIFVAGVGTGGTVSGTGRFLKSKKPEIQVVAVEPAGSPVLSGGPAGKHDLQGIGAGFIPATMDVHVCDTMIMITDEEAYMWGRLVAEKEGILVGITSGAAVCAAAKLAQRPENEGKMIVVVLPDTGDRYLSTKLFAE